MTTIRASYANDYSGMVLFYGGFMSQWHPSPFTIDYVDYNCAEQYMMAQKALLFQDHERWNQIMGTDSPAEQKALGKTVWRFDANTWRAVARDVVFRGNIAKFDQNDKLRYQLRATGHATLVEASPTDVIWGIGLAESDPRAYDRKHWRGRNWLGETLEYVRLILCP